MRFLDPDDPFGLPDLDEELQAAEEKEAREAAARHDRLIARALVWGCIVGVILAFTLGISGDKRKAGYVARSNEMIAAPY